MKKELILSFKVNPLKNLPELGEIKLLNDKYCQEINGTSQHGGINRCFNKKSCKLHE